MLIRQFDWLYREVRASAAGHGDLDPSLSSPACRTGSARSTRHSRTSASTTECGALPAARSSRTSRSRCRKVASARRGGHALCRASLRRGLGMTTGPEMMRAVSTTSCANCCSACAAVYRDNGSATLTAARGVPSAASTGTATEIAAQEHLLIFQCIPEPVHALQFLHELLAVRDRVARIRGGAAARRCGQPPRAAATKRASPGRCPSKRRAGARRCTSGCRSSGIRDAARRETSGPSSTARLTVSSGRRLSSARCGAARSRSGLVTR